MAWAAFGGVEVALGGGDDGSLHEDVPGAHEWFGVA